MKGIAVVLKSPLAEVFGLSGVSYFKSYENGDDFETILLQIQELSDIGLVIVSADMEEKSSKILKNKIVVGV
jgi:vacuolar-type H+-ATPase subunit F/Vma7